MRVVFLMHPFTNSGLLFEVAKKVADKGDEVQIITGFPSRRLTDEQRQFFLDHPIEKLSERITVKRVGSRAGEGTGLLSRMIRYLFVTRQIYKEAKKTDADVYFIYSNPPFLGWIGSKLVRKAPTIYNAQDLFPDTLIQLMNLSSKNLLVRYLRFKEQCVYRDNSRIVTISEDMRDTLISNGCSEHKIDVIYNWVDINSVHHVERSQNRLMDELGIDKSKFIISYAGTIGLFQGMDTVVECACILKNVKDIQFVIIGDGAYKATVEKRIQEEKLNNIIMLPLQPSSRLSEVYSIGDLELVTIGKNVTRTSLPSKTWKIASAGSAILAIVDKPSRLSTIIEENDMGYAVAPDNAAELATIIQQAYNDRKDIRIKGEKARKFAIENVEINKQTEKYYAIMKYLSDQ